MYCRHCGEKVEKKDKFCSGCGRALKRNVPLIDFKNMPKNIQKTLITLIVILILLLGGNNLYKYYFSEEAVIRNYMIAYLKGDYNTVVKLSGTTQNEFINDKNILEKYTKTKNKKIAITNITDNKHKEKEYVRTVTYIVDGYKNTQNLTIKKSGRKFIFFNNYIITSNDLIAKNVLFTVPKDATLIIDNVTLTKKYLEQEKGDLKTYKVDSLLRKNVKINLITDNKLNISDIKSVFNNEEISYEELNYNIIDENTTKTLETTFKNTIINLVNGTIDNKEIGDINDNKIFNQSILDNQVFIDNYNKMKEKYNHQVNSFEIKNIEIENVKLTDNKIIGKIHFTYSYLDSNNNKRENSRVVEIDLNKELKVEEFYLNSLLYMF